MIRAVVFVAVALVASTWGQTTEITQCIHNSGFMMPINAYIIGCQTPPCLLPQLDDVVINIVFRAPRTMRSMQTLATAFLNLGIINIPIEYPLQENAVTCNFLQNSFCPVVEDEVLQYELRMFIDSFMPVDTQVTIEFRVVDETRAPVFCLRVVIRIIDPIDGVSGRNATVVEIA